VVSFVAALAPRRLLAGRFVNKATEGIYDAATLLTNGQLSFPTGRCPDNSILSSANSTLLNGKNCG
jgi:hypothetical protein